MYVAGLSWMPWAGVRLPAWLRWTGVGLAVAAVALITLAHRALDGSFSPTIRLRRRHTLVTSGPYLYVRHPMYAAYLVLFIGAFLLSADWVIGAGGVGVILTLMIVRLPREERRLEERFGGVWLAYRQATGAFLPRFARLAPCGARRLRAAVSGPGSGR